MTIFKTVQNYIFCFKSVIQSENFFDVYNMSVGLKLKILKICLTIVTLMILGNLEAGPEDTMHLRRLIKGSN